MSDGKCGICAAAPPEFADGLQLWHDSGHAHLDLTGVHPATAVPEAQDGRVWGTRWSNGFVTEYPDEAEARRAMTNQNEKTLVYCDVEWKEA